MSEEGEKGDTPNKDLHKQHCILYMSEEGEKGDTHNKDLRFTQTALHTLCTCFLL